MQYFAHVVDGVVREIQTFPDGAALEDCCAPDFAAQLVPCTAAVEQGHTWNGKKFAAPVAPVPTGDELLIYANKLQWSLVLGGYTAAINGGQHLFACDGESAAFVASKLQRLALPNPPTSFRWQLLSGNYITIQDADFEPLAVKLDAFVQATFDVGGGLSDAIQAGAVTTFAEIDAAPWPTNHD